MKKVSRRVCAFVPVRKVSVLVPLAICVIVLQTFILINMNSEAPRGTNEVFSSSVETHSTAQVTEAAAVLSTGQAENVTMAKTNPFDLAQCGCGLHFRVDRLQAQLFPVPVESKPGRKYLTIGIPTVKRRDESYIVRTVASLLSNMKPEQQRQVIIVVMSADTDPESRNFTLHELIANHKEAIDAGRIHVIAPPFELYSNFKVTKQTYGQDLPYVEWRSKQNFDYAYLMRYSVPLSLYYMQLEDDVIAAKNYITHITEYIENQTDPWTCLEFSELGFIGKLYRASDIDRLSQMLMMFFQEQPVDYTYLYFNMLMTQLQKRMRTPTLFQHQGIHSSFPGKIQPLKDRFFDDNMGKVHKGHNPPAELFTSLQTYLNFLPRLPYSSSEGYFWSHGAPTAGDTFIVVFERAQRLDRVIIETGSDSHPDDILQYASLKASLTMMKNSARVECTNDIELGQFSGGKIQVKDIGHLIKYKIMCLQIQVLKSQSMWAIVREIAVFVLTESVACNNHPNKFHEAVCRIEEVVTFLLCMLAVFFWFLQGKIQPLKDRYFDIGMVKTHLGDNPPAQIYTSLQTYLHFVPDLCYSRDKGHFWSHGAPIAGDRFIVVFDSPQRLDRVVVETGTETNPYDIVVNALLKASLTLWRNATDAECIDNVHLGHFAGGRIEVENISRLVKVKAICLEIQVVETQAMWAIIREIAVFVLNDTSEAPPLVT